MRGVVYDEKIRQIFIFIALCFPLSLFFIHQHIETKSDEDLKNGLSSFML